MAILFKTIYYLYDTFVYRGEMKRIHGKGFSQEHALSVFVFLQVINILTIINFLKINSFWEWPIWIKMIFGFVIYFINRYFFLEQKVNPPPSTFMIIVTLLYVLGSATLFCISS